MSVLLQVGTPKIFMCHGTQDEQIPIERSGRAHSAQLRQAGYDVTYVEYDGPHAYQPEIVEQAVEFLTSQ
jgi:predicted esterase